MEEEIDGLDLEKNYTGESEPVEKTPKKPETKEPEANGDGMAKADETATEHTKAEGAETKEPETKEKDLFGVKGHTPRGVQERINSLSRSNRELKEQNARILAELESFRNRIPNPPEKTRDSFATDEEWIDYRAGLKASEMVESMMAKEREGTELAEAEASFRKSEEDARGKLDDYDDVMSMEVNLPLVDRDLFLYVKKSPLGADILYTLKKIETVRNQFLMTPETGKLAFIKSVEARIRQIREGQSAQTTTTPQATPEPNAAEPPKQPAIRQPKEVRHPVIRGLDPATCSMEEWMENGD